MLIKKGEVQHYVSVDGERSVHVIPESGCYEVYFQKDGYPMQYAFGLVPDKYHVTDVDDAIRIGWSNYPDYEEEMFS